MRLAKSLLYPTVAIGFTVLADGALYGETPVVQACPRYDIAARPPYDGGAIALVAAYASPYAESNLNAFSAQLGLCRVNLTIVYAAGTRPIYDEQSAFEDSVDIEMAHLKAPEAKLYVVEAASNNPASIDAAVSRAYQLVVEAGGGQISMTRSVSEAAKAASQRNR